MSLEQLKLPIRFLQAGQSDLHPPHWLQQYEHWWQNEGQAISDAVDRVGTPWLRMFDRMGNRVDEILYSPDYRRMLTKGYQTASIRDVLDTEIGDQTQGRIRISREAVAWWFS